MKGVVKGVGSFEGEIRGYTSMHNVRGDAPFFRTSFRNVRMQ